MVKKTIEQRREERLERNTRAAERQRKQIEAKDATIARLTRRIRRERQATVGRRPYSHGTVYAIGPVGWESLKKIPVKIGKSGHNASSRLDSLQRGNWMELTFITASPVMPFPYDEEANLHYIFQDKWIRGEWFMLSHEDIKRIRSRWI